MKNSMNNLKKRLVSLLAAALMCISAAAGFGSAACAKQIPDIDKGSPEVSARAAAAGAILTDDEEDPMEALMEMFFGPDSGYSSGDDSVGNTVSFETTDLDGNPVSSSELFRGKKVTVINFWATWCPHCVDELPALQELHKELEANGCQVIGICEDADTSAKEAQRILSENGVTYTNIALEHKMYPMMPHKYLPTTYFVDSEGKILTKPVSGADFEQYEEKLAEALELVGE